MNLVWLRKDLRIQDHPALSKALTLGETLVVFIESEEQWLNHNESEISIEFRKRRVNQLSQELAGIGVKLNVISCNLFSEIPETMLDFCTGNHIKKLFFIREIPWDESIRDERVINLLKSYGISSVTFEPDLIVSQPVLTLDYKPYKVFTPFYKKWLQMILSEDKWYEYKLRYKSNAIQSELPFKPNEKMNHILDHWPVSSKEILIRLNSFCNNKLQSYQTERDYPSLNSTSKLSAYLAFGMIGPRQCLSAIRNACKNSDLNWKDDFWLRELAWRDFYRQLMHHFPQLCKEKNFKPGINIKWNHNPDFISAWKQGLTGYPIIDAAMRQLNQTGWMHNRLRMLTAVFFTKILFHDWRIGEKYFMQNLIDGEFSANNGGWQWSASTGCDAVPYFRIFNPVSQSKKFDAEGLFIRKYIPELKSLSDKDIHFPDSETRKLHNYPLPIVNYSEARSNTLHHFKNNN